MTAAQRAASRLWNGSATLAARLRDRAVKWVRAGRRDDLKGWKAAIGAWARLAALLIGAYALWRIVRALPVVLWLLAPAWVFAAYRAGKSGPPGASSSIKEESTEQVKMHPRDVVREMLLDVLGDRPAVHLSEVLAHLQARGQWEGKKVAHLRARLEALGIIVHPKVKVGGVPTRGVRREDLLAPPRPDGQDVSPEASTAV